MLEAALSQGTRGFILDEVSKAKTFDRAVRHLRDFMRVHAFESGGAPLFSGRWVKGFDQATRSDGFHALHDWDGKADRFNDDIIPVEVANFAERMIRPADHVKARVTIAILLDYYFMHLLGLLALRAWDEGDPNANLERGDVPSRPSARAPGQRPEVRARCRGPDHHRHVALRARRHGLRPAARENPPAQGGPSASTCDHARGDPGVSPAFRARGHLRGQRAGASR